ncbi:hypothetical protein DSL64_07010 [Dyadobacter luteus]|uniref:Collagen-like protein n=1 Tax=Dyadobacter luteus TaxID=2259619 RepID=A0A3D8YDM9_9BACT|nr:hypothetical protein [Dyadobacter luteus]REA62667.1 hypothetical protein DSL64_07010 [Dyadobacter luteus]
MDTIPSNRQLKLKITYIYYIMKKLLIPFIFAIGVLFQSCTGPRGPEGPAGLDGPIGQTFELEKVNFVAGQNWKVMGEFSSANIRLEDSDVVLVYILWAVDGNLPVWRLVPQPIDMPRGVYYNYDFTPVDYTLQIDAPSNAILNSLSADVTQNQTFRIVVLPSDWSARKSGPGVDYSDYEAVKKYFNLDDSNIQKLSAQ